MWRRRLIKVVLKWMVPICLGSLVVCVTVISRRSILFPRMIRDAHSLILVFLNFNLHCFATRGGHFSSSKVSTFRTLFQEISMLNYWWLKIFCSPFVQPLINWANWLQSSDYVGSTAIKINSRFHFVLLSLYMTIWFTVDCGCFAALPIVKPIWWSRCVLLR